MLLGVFLRGSQANVASGLASDLVSVTSEQGGEFCSVQVGGAASSGNDLILDKMKSYHSRARVGLKMAAHGVLNHFAEFIHGVGLSVNRVADRTGIVPAFRGLLDIEDDFAFRDGHSPATL